MEKTEGSNMFKFLVALILVPIPLLAMESWDLQDFKQYERDKIQSLREIEKNLKKEINCVQKPVTAYEAALQKPVYQRTLAERELVDLMIKAEKAKLREQIASAKADISREKINLFTKELSEKHDAQMKEVDAKYYHLAETIKKLGYGGSQQLRQKNYDEAIAAMVDFSKSQRQFLDDWTDPKYYK